MSDVHVTVMGHVGQDPTLNVSANGTRWTSMRVASTRRVRDVRSGEWRDGETTWFTVRSYGDRAANVVESVRKGTPVVVTGRLAVEEYTVRKEERGAAGERVEVERPGVAHVVENATVAIDVSRGTARYQRTVHGADLPPGAPEVLRAAAAAASAGADGGRPRDPWETPGEAAAPAGDDGDGDVDAELQEMVADAKETAGL